MVFRHAEAEVWAEALSLVGIVVSYFAVLTTGIWLCRLYSRRQTRRRCQLGSRQQPPTDSVRRKLQLYLYAHTNLGSLLDLLQAVLSGVSCSVYVWETYQVKGSADDPTASVIVMLEFVLSVIFLLDYMFRFFLAKNRMAYVWSFLGVVDAITVLPVLVYVIIPRSMQVSREAPVYLRLVRLIKFLRVLRSLRIVRASLGFGLRRRLFTLIFSVVSLIFVAAGGFHFIEERSGRGMEFHTALYLCTIETLGRPRIESWTDEGSLWLMALVVVSVIIIPKQLAELWSVASAATVWQRRRYEKHNLEHVVVTGHLDFGSVNILLYEFFHKDRGYHCTDVVLFFETPPTREVEQLFEHPAYVHNVQYVQGSPLVEDDLERVGMATASAVVALANKNPHNAAWEDTRILSTVLSVKAFWQRNAYLSGETRRQRILTQVLKPETRHQLLRTPGWQHDDVILVIEEFSSLMVGLNALHRGFTSLIFNLFSHVEEQESAPAWYREYEQGARQEIYRVMVSDSLAGAEMTEAAEYLLIECRIVLVAMETTISQDAAVESAGAGVDLVLYPGRRGLKLKCGDFIYCIAYNVFLVTNEGSENNAPFMVEDRLLEAAETNNLQNSFAGSITNAFRHSFTSATKKPRQSVREWAGLHSSISIDSLRSAGSRRRRGASKESSKDDDKVNVGGLDSEASEGVQRDTHVAFDMANEQLLFPTNPGAHGSSVAKESHAPSDGVEGNHVSFELARDRLSFQSQQPSRGSTGADLVQSDAVALEQVSSAQPIAPQLRPDTLAARKQVLDWLLAEGFAGDRGKMREELANFLQRSSFDVGDFADRCDGFDIPQVEQEMAGREVNLDHTALPSDTKVFWRVPSELTHHVVVFGATSASGLRDLARLIILKSDRSIVVLSPEAPKLVEAANQDGWLQPLSEGGGMRTRRIFFVKGSPNSPSMLDRVSLKKASAAIFLPVVPPEGLPAGAAERQHRMIDSATVALTNFAVGEVGMGLWTVTQMLHGGAVKFFTDQSSWRGASGADPRWLDIAPLNTHAIYAAGQIVAGTMLDRLLIETHFNDKAIPLCGLFIFGDEAGARLFEGPLPERFVGSRYEELCQYLLDLRLLPIGLLRDSHRAYSNMFRPGSGKLCTGTSGKMTMLEKATRRFKEQRGKTTPILNTSSEAQLPYVVTNPEPRLILKGNDRIFVIGLPGNGGKLSRSASDRVSASRSDASSQAAINSSLLARFYTREPSLLNSSRVFAFSRSTSFAGQPTSLTASL